ncbi:MAG TPA: nicotinate phosphoribosyltransferase [Myxococcota bacterium]|nr:nicotinate phosphoribosyltransferase [Myxococcota bacterium]
MGFHGPPPKEFVIFHHYVKNACLLTDFYQFTMAQAYFHQGRHDNKAVFHLFFRRNPFNGNWALVSGINDALDFVSHFKFDGDSINHLATMKNSRGKPFFSEEFLSFLSQAKPRLDIASVKDGEIVFPFEPILRIEGPIFLCQLLETPLLNIVNFQTLIATKAARMVDAAQNKPVVDFGFRRAQGFDGAISASKAAFIGGIRATSNMWASKNFSIPASGTQGHSFVMSYRKQRDAFLDFASVFPDDCVVVVDTFSAMAGIDDAVAVFSELKKKGHQPMGLRLDSGDLIQLSRAARTALDRAGLYDCKIIASGDLDEYEIARLEEAKAPIDVYGVGTRLVTAHDDPALGGVYKLAALEEKGIWRDTFKASTAIGKESWPGPQTIVRTFHEGKMVSDHIVHPKDRALAQLTEDQKELLGLLMRQGSFATPKQDLLSARADAVKSLAALPAALRSRSKAPPYPVVFDDAILRKKAQQMRQIAHEDLT